MARAPVIAAGGIVLRRGETPLIAIVRQRKRNEWVLPKGKLDDGETPKQAAHREVLEETGHEVASTSFWARSSTSPAGASRSCISGAWRPRAVRSAS